VSANTGIVNEDNMRDNASNSEKNFFIQLPPIIFASTTIVPFLLRFRNNSTILCQFFVMLSLNRAILPSVTSNITPLNAKITPVMIDINQLYTKGDPINCHYNPNSLCRFEE
jgi:hypothetical protein